MSGYFKLSDDFDGDVNDALMELIEYRKSKGITGIGTIVDSDIDSGPRIELWNGFLEHLKKGDRYFTGLSLADLNEETGIWTDLDKDESPAEGVKENE